MRDENPSLPNRAAAAVLLGGPMDGREVEASCDAETLLFGNRPALGFLSAYRRTAQRTAEGLVVFSWTGTAPLGAT